MSPQRHAEPGSRGGRSGGRRRCSCPVRHDGAVSTSPTARTGARPSDVLVRPRRPGDLRRLVELLAEQQPTSRYPLRWPLPFPAEDFVVRAGEEAAWVAEVDGDLAGHVAVTQVEQGLAAAFRRACPGQELASVSALFTGLAARGRGVGGRLLDTAVAAVRGSRRVPVLDVVPTNSTAVAVYRHRGWVEVGTARPAWLLADEPDVVLMVLP